MKTRKKESKKLSENELKELERQSSQPTVEDLESFRIRANKYFESMNNFIEKMSKK